jgi:mannonate dehydratase
MRHSCTWNLAIPNFGIGEGGGFLVQLKELFPGCPEWKNGKRYSNDLLGLGIDIDEKIAAKHPPKTPGSQWWRHKAGRNLGPAIG